MGKDWIRTNDILIFSQALFPKTELPSQLNGGLGEARTLDFRIKSAILFLLSYQPKYKPDNSYDLLSDLY